MIYIYLIKYKVTDNQAIKNFIFYIITVDIYKKVFVCNIYETYIFCNIIDYIFKSSLASRRTTKTSTSLIEAKYIGKLSEFSQ